MSEIYREKNQLERLGKLTVFLKEFKVKAVWWQTSALIIIQANFSI